MAIPDYQTAMLPVLGFLKDGSLRRRPEIVDFISTQFGLTADERATMLPSGRTPVIRSRVGWALSYLKQAQLVVSPARGSYRITDRGQSVLATNPKSIDNSTLEQFPEFIEFKQRSRTQEAQDSHEGTERLPDSGTSTPEEALEAAHESLRKTVESELLDLVRTGTPAFFERLVVELLVAMGYGGSREDAGRAVGKSGDEGIDGIINEDRLGLDVIYVQAKKWENTVGRPEIQKFAGAIQGQRARKGIFITTADFTSQAREYAGKIDTRIVLVDGPTLASFMFDYGIGVTPAATYEVKRVDSDYFSD